MEGDSVAQRKLPTDKAAYESSWGVRQLQREGRVLQARGGWCKSK